MVKLLFEGDLIFVKSDYNDAYISRARQIGGKWDSQRGMWCFNKKNEDVLKNLLFEVYGEDGSTIPECVTVEIDVDKFDRIHDSVYNKLTAFGRDLVRRTGRDYPVVMHNTATVVKGGFPDFGGSVKNPKLNCEDGTIIRIVDVPISLVEESEAIHIVHPKTKYINKTELLAEKERIEKRLQEINKILEE